MSNLMPAFFAQAPAIVMRDPLAVRGRVAEGATGAVASVAGMLPSA